MSPSTARKETKETVEFKTDVKQLLDLVTHSLYSHKEIFLRELISNASDAIDKIRFQSLTQPDILEGNGDFKIKIIPDREAKTFTLVDNGIGMTKEDLIEHIGTIAKSGTKAFLEQLQKSGAKNNLDLIGQFGVGFYSSFMVADTVTIRTRTAKGEGWQWVSQGEGKFELQPTDKTDRGTEIILHLKKEAEEFLDEYKIRSIVKKYSDFVEHPITMDVTKQIYPKDKDGNDDFNAKPEEKVEEEILNSRKAIWLKPKNEISEEEHKQFYKHISHDFHDPFRTIHYSAEGSIEFKALLYIPSMAPFNLFQRDAHKGIHLYINRIFIMDDCKKLVPEYLRFIRGVVDSSDLPLNVSREVLQEDVQLEKIRKNIVNKVLSDLKKIKESEPENYLKFWNEFGKVLKEGIYYDHDNKDKILDLLLYETTKTEPGKYRFIKEYVDGMKSGQKEIFYIATETRAKALCSPHLEAFKSKDIEVILMTDQVDEFISSMLPEYDKKPFKSITQGDVDLEDESEKKSKEEAIKKQTEKYGDLLKAMGSKLQDEIKDVRFSTRLTDSACCLVGDSGAMGSQMEQILKSMGQEVPKQKKVLEINPNHPVVAALGKRFESNKEDPLIGDYADLLYNQALLTEGLPIKDPLGFAKKISELMVRGA